MLFPKKLCIYNCVYSSIYRLAKITHIIHLFLLTSIILSTFSKDGPIIIVLGTLGEPKSTFPDTQKEMRYICPHLPQSVNMVAPQLSTGPPPSTFTAW